MCALQRVTSRPVRFSGYWRASSGEERLGLCGRVSGNAGWGYAHAYFGLLEALETLFGSSVDLVEDSAIINPYFRESVEESRIPLYAA